jgi:hypothetical protein
MTKVEAKLTKICEGKCGSNSCIISKMQIGGLMLPPVVEKI